MNRTRVARIAEAERANLARQVAARNYPWLLKHMLQRLFPDESRRAEAVRLLQRYGSATAEPEKDRVHLAILKLAGTNLNRIRSTIDGAKEDYEDTLSWAERPHETQLRLANHKFTAREKAEVAVQDRQEYEDWLAMQRLSSNQSLEPTAGRRDAHI